MEDCIFCKIVKGEIPSEKVMEDNNHLAILSITPVYEGMTIVLTKKHFDSYAYQTMLDTELADLHVFTKKVALLLDEKLSSERCIQVMEGLDVNHVHIKLFPKYKGVYKANVERELPLSIEELKKVSEKLKL